MTRTATSLPYTELPVADGNYGDQSARVPIDRIVIHTMVGTVQGAGTRFNTKGTQVSAHYGVGLDGKFYHWLEEYLVAYHSGDYAMNQRSIGIEHEDGGDYNGTRPDVLYAESAKLVKDICTFYQIPIDRQHILKHSEVIPTGCPDALDIDRIVREAGGGQDSILVPKKDFENLVTKSTKYDAFAALGYQTVDDVTSKIKSLQGSLQGLTDDATKQQAEIKDLTDKLANCQQNGVMPQHREFKFFGRTFWLLNV